tara:strand:+ start:406 stop:699 length:294 start_codon:yes stop_codon:yes gene_type:complete
METNKRGGAREGAGRKSVVEEQKANVIMMNALKELYNKDTDDEAKIHFVKEVLLESQRGQLFVAEHVFGKPKETIETTHNVNNFDIKDLFKVDDKNT